MRETLLHANNETFKAYDISSGAVICQAEETFAHSRGVLVRGVYYASHLSKPLIRCTRLDHPQEPFNRLVLPDVATAFDVTASASRLLVGFKNGRIMAWDLTSGGLMKSFVCGIDTSGNVSYVKISPDEQTVVAAVGRRCYFYAMSDIVHLVDTTAESKEAACLPFATFECEKDITAIDVSFQIGSLEAIVAMGDDSGKLYVWYPLRGDEQRELWICDLYASITAIAIADTLQKVLVASKHPQIVVAEFDVLKCAMTYKQVGRLSWEDCATNWPMDLLKQHLIKSGDSEDTVNTNVRLMEFNCFETLIATAMESKVLIWDFEKRVVQKVISMEGVSDICFGLKLPTVTNICQDSIPVGVPASPPSMCKPQLETSIGHSSSRTTVYEDSTTMSNLFYQCIDSPLYAMHPVPLRLTESNKADILAETACAIEIEKHKKNAEEFEMRLEKARDCYATLTRRIEDLSIVAKRFVEPHQNSQVLFKSVNPLIGKAPLLRSKKTYAAVTDNGGYFIPPPSWQLVPETYTHQ